MYPHEDGRTPPTVGKHVVLLVVPQVAAPRGGSADIRCLPRPRRDRDGISRRVQDRPTSSSSEEVGPGMNRAPTYDELHHRMPYVAIFGSLSHTLGPPL